MNNALVISHMGLGDMVAFNPVLNYMAEKYETVYTPSKKRNYKNVSEMYKHNSKINVISLSEHSDNNFRQEIYEIQQSAKNLSEHSDNLEIYAVGYYNTNRHCFQDLPDNFYKDIGLDISIYDNYFKISDELYEESELSKLLPENFIFTVSKSSTQNIKDKIKSNIISDDLILNTFENLYDKNDKHYELAEKFVNLPFFDYVPVIQKANEIHVIDSAFSLLCRFTSNESQKRVLYCQSGFSPSDNFFKNWIEI